MSNKNALLFGMSVGLVFIFLPSVWPLFGDFTSYLNYILEPLPTYVVVPIVIFSLSLVFYLIMLVIFGFFANKSLFGYYSVGVFISLIIFLAMALIAISQFQFGF